MAITPAPGWMVDPNNPNAVIPISSGPSSSVNPNASYFPQSQPTQQIQQPVQQPVQQPQYQAPQQIQQPTQQAPSTPTPPSTSLQPGAQGADVSALQSYLVQMGYLTPDQVSTGPGTYGPQTTAAVAKLQQDLGIQAGSGKGYYGPQTQAALASKYQSLYQSQQGSPAPQSGGDARALLGPQLAMYNQPSTDPVFGAMASSMEPIMQSLAQVLSNINNPALTGVSLQQEYNDLAQQNNLPSLNAQLMNMNNVMNGSEQDIRDEITKAGGFATDSQVMAMSGARNKVILKQYNALSTQYSAAQQNVQNMMQYASADQQTQLQKQQMTASVTENMASIYQQMVSMGMTMQSNARQAAQYNISQTGYQAFAQTLQGNPQMQGYYENLLQLAPGTLSNPSSLASLDTYKQQSLQMTSLLRDTQLYNAGLINQLPASDLQGTGSSGNYGTATSTISQMTGIDPSTPLSQVDAASLVPAIIQNEGGSPQGVQNNPGNIKYTGLPGQINSGIQAKDGGTFASYPTPQAGQQAILSNIQSSMQKNPGMTLGSFVDRYTNTAPKNSSYISPGITTGSPSLPNNGSGSQAFVAGTLIPPSDGPNGSKLPQAITSVTGLSVDAFRYITMGQPALTRMPYGQQRKVKAEVQSFLDKNGVDLSTFQSQYTAYNTTLGQNIQRFNNTQIAEGEVLGTLKNLNAPAISSQLGSVNLGNVAKVLAGQQVNDQTASEYAFYFNDLKNSLSYYYAAQQGKSSPDIIDNEDAANVIVGGIAKGGVTGLQNATTQTTLKMKAVLANAVDSAQRNVWSLFGVQDQYTPSGTKGQLSNSQFVAQALQDNQVDSYDSLLSKIPTGKIGVIDNMTEEIVAIDPSTFNSSKYTKL